MAVLVRRTICHQAVIFIWIWLFQIRPYVVKFHHTAQKYVFIPLELKVLMQPSRESMFIGNTANTTAPLYCFYIMPPHMNTTLLFLCCQLGLGMNLPFPLCHRAKTHNSILSKLRMHLLYNSEGFITQWYKIFILTITMRKVCPNITVKTVILGHQKFSTQHQNSKKQWTPPQAL